MLTRNKKKKIEVNDDVTDLKDEAIVENEQVETEGSEITIYNQSIANYKQKRTVAIFALSIMIFLFISILLFVGFSYYQQKVLFKGLSKKDSGEIIFYYPYDFDEKKDGGGEFVFVSRNRNKFGGVNSIRTLDDKTLQAASKINDAKTCGGFGEGKLDEEVDASQIKGVAENVRFSDFLGRKTCYFLIEYDAANFGLDGKVIAEVKIVSKSGKTVGVVANYDDSTPMEEKDMLSRSVMNFDLK